MRHKTQRLTPAARLLLVSAVLFSALVLIAVPFNRSKTSAQAGGQRETKSSPELKLDVQRRLALKQLYSRLRAGDPFSREEIDLLTRFAAGDSITELEADTLMSRTLYNRYVINNALSKEQESLLDLYSGSVARREHDIADLKFSALKMRSAGAAAPVAVRVDGSPNVPAVAPTNDLCAGAEVISGSGPFPVLTAVTADVTEATLTGDPPLPSCQSNVSRSIWYTFTPTTTANYTISSCDDSPTGSTVDDTVIAIYTSTSACGGTFSQIAGGCDDDSCISEGLQSVITTPLNSGTQYFVVVWEFDATPPTAGNTAVQLRVTQAASSPANDLCAGAEVIPGSGPFPLLTAVTADITVASVTGDPPLPSCQSSISRSIWYTFTPTTTANYTISSCADSPTGSTVDDTVMAIYTGSCGGPFVETGGCDDDSCISEVFQSVITAPLNSGTQYFVVVWEFGTTAPTAGNTAVQLRVTQAPLPPPPANDTCGSAVALALDTPVAGTTVDATNDYSLTGTTCFSGVGQTSSTAVGRDVAYSFTAPTAGTYSFKVTNYSVTSNLVLYAATSCPSAGAVTCDSAAGPVKAAANRSTASFSEEVNCMSLASSQQVFIFVDENAATAGSTFTIEANRCIAETEPNGTPATGSPIPFGVEGSITPAGDSDFYQLGTPVLGSRVFALADGVASNSNDFDMRITTATDTLEYDDVNNDGQFGGLSPNVAGTPLTGAASFIRMNHFTAGTQSEPYRLYATVQPPGAGLGLSSATAEGEPNDTTGQANSAANNYFSGSLAAPAPSTDIDLFSFSATAGDLIFLSLDLDPLRDNTPINGALELDDLSGTLLISVNDGGSTSSTTSGTGSLVSMTPTSPGEGLVWRARYTGVYFARVFIGTNSTGVTGAGDYLLSISRNGQIGPTAANGTVTGRVTDPSGVPVAGAVVNLSGTQNRKFITDANGNYRFENVETNGFYSVTPTMVNYHFSPESRSFSQLGNNTEAAFTATRDSVVGVNRIDTAEYFVRQHYLDFLGREPDESGFNFWSDQILGCGGDVDCIERRTINVSAAYFLSIEFQQTGGLVDGLYRASYGRAPRYAEFMPDSSVVARDVVVGRANWAQTLEANKQAFVAAWMERADFRAAYDGLTNDAFVDSLISHTAGFNGDRSALVSGLNGGSLSRAAALRQIVENEGFVTAKQNEMFVMMEYFGYLRRDPDAGGYAFWLNKLNEFNGNFERAEMVKAFLVSGEYRDRFRQ